MYSLISTPKEFFNGFSFNQYKDDVKKHKRKYKRELVTDMDKITFVKQEYERRRLERLYFELKWQLNMAFIEGNQYKYISALTNSLVEFPKEIEWQERGAYNHMHPIYTTRLAKLSRLNLNFKASPATSDSSDINNAYVTTKVLKYWAENARLNKIQNKANAWMEQTGTAVWKTIWNNKKGKKIGERLNENGEKEFVFEGDVDNVVCSPFEIFPDSSYNEDVEFCNSIIHARVVDVDYIYDNFNVDILGTENALFSSQLTAIMSIGADNGFELDKKKKTNSLMLYEYYENPSKEFPNGRLIIVSDRCEKVLYEGELPLVNANYNNRRLPFNIQRSFVRPGYFWGRCILDDVIPVQRRYNAIKNRTAEYMNRVAIGVMVVDSSTYELNDLEETGVAPGQIIQYKASESSSVPQYMQSPPLPNEFFNQEQMELGNFTKISGVSEVSRDSSAPSGISSGRALMVLQEQDDTRFSLTARNIQDCMLEVASKTLYAYKQFVELPRMIKICGENDGIKVLSWDKNTLTAEDIMVDGVARIGETLPQKRNMVLELINLGLFRDQNGVMDSNKILEMLEFGSTDVALDINRLEKQKTSEENTRLMVGTPVSAQWFELHEVAIDAHKEFMLTSDYTMLTDDIKQMFEEHLRQHIDYVQQAQAQMLQEQIQQNGKEQ